jgi:hypothetical protein
VGISAESVCPDFFSRVLYDVWLASLACVDFGVENLPQWVCYRSDYTRTFQLEVRACGADSVKPGSLY